MKNYSSKINNVSLPTAEQIIALRDECGVCVGSEHAYWIDSVDFDGDPRIVYSSGKISVCGTDGSEFRYVRPITVDVPDDVPDEFFAYGYVFKKVPGTNMAFATFESGLFNFEDAKADAAALPNEPYVVTSSTTGEVLDEFVVMNDGEVFADDTEAMHEGYVQCDKCGEWGKTGNFTYIENTGEYICWNCMKANRDSYFVCNECGKTFTVDAKNTESDIDVCEECLHEYYSKCYICGKWTRTYSMQEMDGEYVCNDCYKQTLPHVLKYHSEDEVFDCFYRVENGEPKVSRSEKDGILYIGVEDEIDNGKNGGPLTDWINKSYGHDRLYLMHDGSLSEVGIEMITQPATAEWHEKFGDYDELFDACKEYHYDSDFARTCGLHCHVNRSFFRNEKKAIANLMILFDRFWDDKLVPLSRRVSEAALVSDGYAAKNSHSPVYEEDDEATTIDKMNPYGDRYHAINTCNDNTIEFRLFQGTLDYENFLGTIWFVDHICRYANDHSLKDCETVSWKDFTSGITNQHLKKLLTLCEDTSNSDKKFYRIKKSNVLNSVLNVGETLKQGETYRVLEWEDLEGVCEYVANGGRLMMPGGVWFLPDMRDICGHIVSPTETGTRVHVRVLDSDPNDVKFIGKYYFFCASMLTKEEN